MAKRGYIGGFCWAFLGDTGDDGVSWQPLVGVIVGGAVGCLVDRFIAPFGFALIGALGGLLAGAIIVAIRVADEPRRLADSEKARSDVPPGA